MKRLSFIFLMGLTVAPLAAQETYQSEKLIANDLNGTARYVGMGGAMEALGADISTINTNPAGIGLFRKSQFAISGGFVAQGDAKTSFSYDNVPFTFKGDKTNASFDQAGFVWAKRTGSNSFLNFAFNFHKSKNFDQILSTAGALSKASQNKLTSNKYSGNKLGGGQTSAIDAAYAGTYDNAGNYILGLMEYYTKAGNVVDPSIVTEEGLKDGTYVRHVNYAEGQSYRFGQYQHGYIGNYDFNISGNINDQIYLGLTFGIHDVHYNSDKVYNELLESDMYSQSWEKMRITGAGFDAKLGAIFRPIADSPFRFGIYMNTPVFYDLRLRSSSDVEMGKVGDNGSVATRGNDVDYDFHLYTPWKFGLSLGHTIGDYLALGFTYEYSDYGSLDNRIDNGDYYDPVYDVYYDDSSSDDAMNDNTKDVLKGVHTLKFGVEYRPIKALSLRLGYNYVSPKFEKNEFRDQTISSPGTAYATSTDYTNWKCTNRVTAGIGYSFDKFFMDLAYQYSQMNGDFYPFQNYPMNVASTSDSNYVSPSSVNFKRHQMLFTIGYKF